MPTFEKDTSKFANKSRTIRQHFDNISRHLAICEFRRNELIRVTEIGATFISFIICATANIAFHLWIVVKKNDLRGLQ